MNSSIKPGGADPRYSKRLAIVVPYRDRAEHLARFVPHLVTYFQRDKLDKQIAVTVNIIEQWGKAPFSRGRLGNCGFLLTRETSDYVCIHDVDYLLMWADYSWTKNPARLIWHGLSMQENWETFFGAVSLLDNSVFTAVNGFPNCYWGWGPEDLELSHRLRLRGFEMERRDGTFIPLPHKHAGFSAPQVWTEEGRRTNALFAKRQREFDALIERDGLSTLKFRVLEKKPLALTGVPALANVFHYLVDLGEPEPSAV
ncbi:MAG TPA: galactosyltransferase-related protein [Pseudolabrys sp.]|nr:galactosyltransferase-related protein [Pseudolabrys sp.]